jgi:catechol 2,3-dioxygenase-like lactoylglutathione lyase family enzyme
MSQANAPTNITGVRTIGIPVADQDRALEFYLGRLGFEKRMDFLMGPGARWIEVAPPGASTTIALVHSGAEGPAGIDTQVRLATRDAEADHADLRERGVDVDPEIIRLPGVPPMFAFRDPDGNRLILVEAP